MNTRPAFAKAARRHGLFCERLEDRVNPVRGISTDSVIASINAVNPLGVLHRAAASGIAVDPFHSESLGYGLVKVALPKYADPNGVVTQLQLFPQIRSAQPNYVYEAPVELVPNDSKYSLQSNLTVTRMPQAWDVLINAGKTLGNSGTVVAVLDEGIPIIPSTATPGHSDLADGPGTSTGIALNSAELNNSLDDDGNGFLNDYAGWDFIENDNDPSPAAGANHGLEVAGIIAARINNTVAIGAASAIAGIAGGTYDAVSADIVGGVRILPIRVINGSTLTTASLAGGLNYAASRFVRIANLSFDTDSFANDTVVMDAMNNLYDSGCLIVASAGNTGTKDSSRGVFDQVLFVAGTSNSDKLSQVSMNTVYSSNYGEFVDISAPSENVISLQGSTSTTTAGAPNTYGTSLAAPAVAGTAALLLAQNPSYTRDQLAARLLGTAVNIDALNPGFEGTLGSGRLDALNALTASLAAPTITAMTANGVTIQEGGTVNSLTRITLSVPSRLIPASVNSGSFELRSDGQDNTFGTGDDLVVPLSVASPYRIGAGSITLNLDSLLVNDHYRFTAKSGLPYLRDPFNVALNGTAGNHFVREFDLAAPAIGANQFPANTVKSTLEGPASAVFSDGSSVTVWAVDGVDGDAGGIVARRFDAFGQPLGAEFLVNSTVVGDQRHPSVTATDNDGFVIGWLSVSSNGISSVMIRRFDPSGLPVGSQITVNPNLPNDVETRVAVARGLSNGFYLGYTTSVSNDGGFTFHQLPVVRRYNSANIPGVLTQVNPSSVKTQAIADLASDSLGNYYVLYGRYDQNWDAFVRGYTSNGTALDVNEITVSASSTEEDVPKSIAIDGNRNWMAIYESAPEGTSAYSIRAKTYDVASGRGSNSFEIATSFASTTGYHALKLLKDIFPGSGSGFFGDPQFTRFYSELFFVANDGSNGFELWKSDGTAAGTTLVSDIRPGSASSSPSQLVNVNGTLYFTANNGTSGTELWKSDGTSTGTVLVRDIQSGIANANLYYLTNLNGTLLFAANEGTNGTELWRSNGSSTGTVIVRDIFPGSTGSIPSKLTNVNGTLLFAASNSSTTGRELWKSDGTFAGTVLVKDVNPAASTSGIQNLKFMNVGNMLFFYANDGPNGQELWKSDGSSTGTILVKDIRPGSLYSSVDSMINANGTLYFRANDGTTGFELFRSNGTSTGTTLISDILPGIVGSSPTGPANIGSTIYFSALGFGVGTELFKSDGTSTGTVLVKDIAAGSANSAPTEITPIGNQVYFTNGLSQIWRTDGTSAGTRLLGDLNGGEFIDFNGVLFASIQTGVSGEELWISDNWPTITPGGPHVVADAYGQFRVVWADTAGADILSRQYTVTTGEARSIGAVAKVNLDTPAALSQPSIAINAAGRTVVAWAKTNTIVDEIDVVHSSSTPRLAGLRVSGDTNSISAGERVVQTVSELVAGFTAPLLFSTVTDPSNWQLVIDGVDKTSQIASIDYVSTPTAGLYEATINLDSPIISGNVQLRARDSIRDTRGNALDGDANGAFGGDFLQTFTVANIGLRGSLYALESASGTQGDAVTTFLPDGRYVTAYISTEAGNPDVFGQIFDASNNKLGSPFMISNSALQDLYPSIDSSASGSFVVTWPFTNGTGSFGVAQRRYGSDGKALDADQVIVVQESAYDLYYPMVTVAPAGNHWVAWTRAAGTDKDVYVQAYDAAGAKIGSATRVNANVPGDQYLIGIDVESSNQPIIAFQDPTAGFPKTRRLYTGTSFSPELQFNGEKLSASASGDYVGAGGSGAVYVSLYNRAGVLTKSPTLVTPPAGPGSFGKNADVAVDDDGDFSVVWESTGSPLPADIWVRQFNSAGVAISDALKVANVDFGGLGGARPRIALSSKSDGVITFNSVTGPMARRLGTNDTLTTTGIETQLLFEDAVGKLLNFDGKFSDPNNPTPTFTYQIVGNTNPVLLTGLPASTFPVPILPLNPSPNRIGSTVLTVRASIVGGLFVDASFAVIVQPVNDPPVFVKGADITSIINSAPLSIPNWATGMNAGPTESDTVSFEIVSNSNPTLFSTLPAISSSGTLSFAQVPGEYGAAVLQVRAHDTGGTANGGVDTSPTQTFVITVDPTNPNNRQFGTQSLANSNLTAGAQEYASIATDGVGNRVVVWDGPSGDGTNDAFGQIYAANGTPVGSNFRINQTTAGHQKLPHAAFDPQGNILITWSGGSFVNNDSDVYVRRFNAYGVPLTDETLVNSVTAGAQLVSSVGVDASGAFAIAWMSGPLDNAPGNTGQDGDGYGIYARRFDAAGQSQTPEFPVNQTTTNNQLHPNLAMSASGQFTVAWQSDAGGSKAYARLYDSQASAMTSELLVGNTSSNILTVRMGVAADADGDFVVAYESGSGDIAVRQYSASGAPAAAFTANPTLSGAQSEPSIAMDADGDFIVAWWGEGSGDTQGIFAQRFARSGTVIGTELRLSTQISGIQQRPIVTMDADSDAHFVWTGDGPGDTDGVHSRRHAYPEPTGVTTAPIVNDGDGLIDLGVLFNNNSGPQEALGFSLGAIVNSGSLSKKSISGRTLNVEFDPSVNGSTEVTVRVADTTEGLNGLGTIVIRRLNFASPNAAPILDFIRDRTIDEGGTLSLTASAIDKQGANNLVYSLQKTNPGGTAIGASNGKLTWTSSDNGVVEMTVRVTDPDNTYWTQETFAVTVKNADPTASFSGPAVVLPNGTPTFAFTGMSDVASDLPTLRFAYDYDNNGTWDAGGATYATALTSSSKTAPGTFFSTAGTTRTVRGRVLDKDGGFTDYFTSVNVENIGGTITPPAAVVTVNTGPQRSNVTILTVAFDQPVSFPNGLNAAFTLTRAGSAGTVPLNFDLVGNTMTITFVPGVFTSTTVAEPSLIDGNYTFTVVAANVAGNAGPMPSNIVTGFKRLFGDGDGNGTVNADDLALFGNAFGASLSNTNYSAAFDFDANGAINADDFAQFGNRFGVTL